MKGSPGVTRKSLMDTFNENTEKAGDECWLWTGRLQNRTNPEHEPYGMYKRRCSKKHGLAHRLSWELHHGAVPVGLCVLHRCDVRLCVNPAHLFLGTVKDNQQDMTRKGRGVAKLSESDVREIKRRLAGGERLKPLAIEFGVMPSAISHVRTGRTHAWVTA